MGGDFGKAMKVAIPLGLATGAILLSGGAAAPAAAPVMAGEAGAGAGSAALAGAGGLEGASAGLTEATGAGGLFAEPLYGIPSFTPAATAGVDLDKGITRGFQGLMGGQILSNLMTPPPAAPFQMGSAQAPSPVGGGGGRFTPTAEGAMQRLAATMANRPKAPRFA